MSPDQEEEIAFAVLSVIERAIMEWRNAKSGAVKPDDVLARLSSFTQGIADNDQKTDSAAQKKFHP